MGEERFDRLEGPDELPGEVRQALSSLSRFEHLEIGAFKIEVRAAPQGHDKLLCPHCGQANERERETCWACFKALSVKAKSPAPAAGPQDVTLVLDGNTYRSTDSDVPDDVKVLMDRIRKEGYSEKLLIDWRSWRATRRSPPPPRRPFEETPEPGENAGEDAQRDIKVFKGQRVSVIRLDGQVYTSDDPKLSSEMRQLFAYVEAHGVTPALMEYLRQFGSRVKFRPADTLMPSDGDLSFWSHVNAQGAGPAADVARWQAETDLELARRRVNLARGRLAAAAVAVVLFFLYIIVVFGRFNP